GLGVADDGLDGISLVADLDARLEQALELFLDPGAGFTERAARAGDKIDHANLDHVGIGARDVDERKTAGNERTTGGGLEKVASTDAGLGSALRVRGIFLGHVDSSL